MSGDAMGEQENIAKMSDAQLFEYCRDNAQRWAAAFCQIKETQGFGSDDIDEGLMIGWFASAIEQATAVRCAAIAALPAPAGVEVTDEQCAVVCRYLGLSEDNSNFSSLRDGLNAATILAKPAQEGQGS